MAMSDLLCENIVGSDVLRAVDWCERVLQGYGFDARRHPSSDTPTQDYDVGAHATWMCAKIRTMVVEERREKAMRWLGFVQGVIFSLCLAPVDHIEDVNRPREGGDELDRAREGSPTGT